MTQKLIRPGWPKPPPDGTIGGPHAGAERCTGRSTLFLMQADIILAWTLDLTSAGCLHEWHVQGDGDRHPLHFVESLSLASAGEGRQATGFSNERQNSLTIAEPDPVQAIAAYQTGGDVYQRGLPHEKNTLSYPLKLVTWQRGAPKCIA